MQPEAQAALRQLWLKQELARYQQQVETRPDDAAAWRRLARIYWESGEAEQALTACERVVALQPEDSESWLGCVVARLALGRDEEALAATTRLLELFPNHLDALLHQIEALRRLGRTVEALAVCERVLALALTPEQLLNVLHGKANLQFQINQRESALATVDHALMLAPDSWDFRLNRARLLYRLRRFAEALDEIESLVDAPTKKLVAAQCVKARILAALRRFDEADAVLDDLRTQYPHAVLEREFEPWRLPDETSADSLRKRYTGRGLYMAQVFEAQQECEWTDWDAVLADLDDLVRDALRYGFVAGLEPHRLLGLPIDPALQLVVAKAQATAVDTLMAPVRQTLGLPVWTEAGRRSGVGRLRVGYVSGDFRDHATAHLIRKLFRLHDRERFEVFGYSLRPGDGSRYWRDIAQSCDHFVELHGQSNAQAATRISADGVQVLVDLHGYTRFARPEIFALRPAPVQIAFLGYPGTLGADYTPYIIADSVVLPEYLRPCFSEQAVYLECYQINDDEQPIAEIHLTRAAAGLPEEGFVYCCFNTTYKIEPGVFDVWMRILRQTSGSVLWLLADTPRCAEHLRAAASARGVAPERLIFASRLPKAEHLARQRLADLFLDTFIVNAHTTASDALWAGLPVVTCAGATFQSRVCTSLLSALGLQEWVAKDQQEYEKLALALAHDPSRLRDFKAQLAEHLATHPLFMTERFVRQFEQSLMALWMRRVE